MPNQKLFIRFSGYLRFFHVIRLETWKIWPIFCRVKNPDRIYPELYTNLLCEVKDMRNPNGTETIAIDSMVLSYYVSATKPEYNPHKDCEKVKDERVASLQIPLYSEWYAILPTVRKEYLKIKEICKRDFHVIADQVFHEYRQSDFNATEVKKRAECFNQHHKGAKNYNDCMLAAEAEFLSDTTVLLSNDKDLIKNVSPLTNGLLIIRPTEFIAKFGISNNKLRISPAETHPRYHDTWWRF